MIDLENFDSNSFHVVTELTFRNGDEEFRPDIVLLVNGMPLAFVEVKKLNNKDGTRHWSANQGYVLKCPFHMESLAGKLFTPRLLISCPL